MTGFLVVAPCKTRDVVEMPLEIIIKINYSTTCTTRMYM